MEAFPPRLDLRQYDELRPVAVEFSVASEATSSIIYSQGDTKVAVSIYGPSQPRFLRQEQHDKCTLDVEFRANNNTPTSRNYIENDGVAALKSVLESTLLLSNFPRMMISIKVNVLHDDGSLHAVSINACSLALCKGGLPMSFMPIAVKCVETEQKMFLIDPSHAEEDSCISQHSFTYKTSDSPNIISSLCSGCFSPKTLQSATSFCDSAVQNLEQIMKGHIVHVLK